MYHMYISGIIFYFIRDLVSNLKVFNLVVIRVLVFTLYFNIHFSLDIFLTRDKVMVGAGAGHQ